MPTPITVATANTHWGRAVQVSDGLQSLSKVDILLLQEVGGFQKKTLEKQLGKVNFRLMCSAPQFGLAIAIRQKSPLVYIPNSTTQHRLAKMSFLERKIVQTITHNAPAFTERGMLSAQVKTPEGFQFTVATAHPTTPISTLPKARHRQIVTLQKLLGKKYANMPLILGGDMNHYRGPRAVDLKMHTLANLTPIELGIEPTWYVRGSKQEKILALAARVLRQPLDIFNGQHDIILYRKKHFTPTKVEVRDIYSDHRAVIAVFSTR